MFSFRSLTAFAVSAAAAFLIAACGPTASTCGPGTCDGCCEGDVCRTGNTDAACGVGGNNCNVCVTGQACTANVCVTAMADGGTGGGAGGGTGGGAGGGGGTTMRGNCTATAVACSDQAILQLGLFKPAAAAGKVNTVADGSGFLSTIDATGGGLTPSQSFVYAKFTSTGLEQVAVGDETALDAMDWDIAFRRFIIRLNGGDSGPACTTASEVNGTTYDALASVPTGLTYASDNFLGDAPTCTFIDDGSGLGTSPSTALASFYQYTSCVAMTGKTYVVQTSEEKHVKLTVTTYYSTVAGQDSCNAGTGTMGAVGGTIRVRWAWLD